MKKTITLLGVVLALSGCAKDLSPQEINAAVSARAAYDLDCKEAEIKITSLQESRYDLEDVFNTGTYGAAGCGKKMTFTVVNQGARGKIMVYKEGAAPNPVVGVNPVTPQPTPNFYTPMRATGHY